MRGISLVILGLLISISPLFAQARMVSLQECITIALDNHPDMMAAYQYQKKAAAGYNLAKAGSRVYVVGEVSTVEYLTSTASQGKINIPGRDTAFGLFAGVSASYNLVDARQSRITDSARLSVDLAKINIIKVRENITLSVKKAYYGYLFSRENQMLRGELMKKFQIKLEKAKMLFKNGQRPILDVSKAEVDMANARLEFEKAKNQENLTKSELLHSMGIMDENIGVYPAVIDKMPQVRFSLKEIYSLAENYYPEMRIARYTRDLNKLNISVEKAAHLPTVDILGSVGFENRNLQYGSNLGENFTGENWNPTLHAGLKARLPIYSGGGISAKIDAAVAEYNRSVYQERVVLINMKTLIRNHFQTMFELLKQIEISRLMKESANKHLMLAQKSYENGIGSQLDMQDAEMAVLNADLSYLKAKYDYLTALANLANLVGLGEEYICQKQ